MTFNLLYHSYKILSYVKDRNSNNYLVYEIIDKILGQVCMARALITFDISYLL